MKKGVKVVKVFLRSKRKTLLGVIVSCVVLASGLIVWWQTQPVVEAAILDPHPGLVGWWRFDEGTENLAEDSSGNGNDGTVYGASWVDGKYGKALSFDGIDDYVEVPSDSSINFGASDFTVSCYIKTSADIMTRQSILGKKWDIYTGNLGYAISIVGGNFEARIADGAVQAVAYKPAVAEIWQHVVLVRNGSNFALYSNGESGTTVTKTVGDISHDFNFRVGRATSGGYPLNAIVDEVRVYNRALSAVEVQENFQGGPDFSSRLLAKVPKGTTQIITTVSWQGTGSINITVESPSESYTEDTVPVYQKTAYSTSDGATTMLNIKRLSISVSALSSDENWYILLDFDDIEDYSITVEVQK